ncbi:A24 family peptidase [Desulfitobacterium metallireducens]|uniref:Peptidase A24 n=1 Tax=Desulfitobacterium metallireducens DSM 15288 TaxID=871968 RepID=W0E7N4_9FIRM|nr:prepilin peptidase [Desulfitobacterium metallireducens]AHF06870.1 peptidase A24 [Desulfitobacterium metallireducens DSM 15288]
MGLTEVVLGFTLSIAAFTDWREHRIHNKLLGPAFLVAIFLQTFFNGWAGLKESTIGALVGFGILLIPYLFGGMGAGDVKLLAVIGAFGGAHFVITSFLYGAIIGGVISVALLVRHGALGATLKRFLLLFPLLSKPEYLSEDMRNARKEKFPYGIAIVLGTALEMFIPFPGGF